MTTEYTPTSKQRHTPRFTCPVCGGHDQLPRGKGTRCTGWTSADASWTHCSREELAGTLPEEGGGTYAHRMEGDCRCGREHGGPRPAPVSRAPRAQAQRSGKRRRADGWRPDVSYPYIDGGRLVFEVCRWGNGPGKRIRQRQPRAEGGWWADLDGVERVPYRLPELLAADPAQPVFTCAGEKDANRLAAAGLVATTNPEGERKGAWRPELTPHFAGRHVVVLIDNDPTGIAHGAEVAAALADTAASIKLLRLPGLPDHGDISDWLDAGHTVDDLLALEAVWPAWQPPTPADDPALRQARADLEHDLNETRRQLAAERAEHQALTELLRNKELRQEIPTALAISYDLRNRIAAGKVDDDGRVTVSLKALQETWGISKARASAHLTTMEAAGLITDKTVTRHATPDGYRNIVTLKPVSTDPVAFIQAVARHRTGEGRGWGGKREACPHCHADLETTGTVTAWERYCIGCGGFIDAGKTHSRRTKPATTPAGQNTQDDAFADAAPDGEPAGQNTQDDGFAGAAPDGEPAGQNTQDDAFADAAPQDSAAGPSTGRSSSVRFRNLAPATAQDTQDDGFAARTPGAARSDEPHGSAPPIRGRMCEVDACWEAATDRDAGRYRCRAHAENAARTAP